MIKWSFTSNKSASGFIVRHVLTQPQVADIFIKGLSTDLFTKHRTNLSVVSPRKD